MGDRAEELARLIREQELDDRFGHRVGGGSVPLTDPPRPEDRGLLPRRALKLRDRRHGLFSTYRNGCRCARCRAAHVSYMKLYAAKRRRLLREHRERVNAERLLQLRKKLEATTVLLKRSA